MLGLDGPAAERAPRGLDLGALEYEAALGPHCQSTAQGVNPSSSGANDLGQILPVLGI